MEYTRDALRLQLQAAQPYQPNTFARDMAQTRLQDLPALLATATPQELRAVVRSFFDRIWVKNCQLNALTPRAEVYPLIASIARVCWGG